MDTPSSRSITSRPARSTSSKDASGRSEFTLVRGDTLDPAALTRAMRGADVVFHLAANADVRFGTEHPRKDLEQNTIATFNVLEAMRANECSPHRVCLDWINLRRGDRHPDTGKRALPGADFTLRRIEARGRRIDTGLLRGLWFSGVDFPVRLDPRRTLHPRPRFRFLQELEVPIQPACGCLETAASENRTFTCTTVIDAMLLAMARATGKVNIFNLGTDEFCQLERFNRLDNRATGSLACAGIHRRRSRMDRRQPVHLPRHLPYSRARLDPEAFHS